MDGPATVRQVEEISKRLRVLAATVLFLALTVLVLSIIIAVLVLGEPATSPPDEGITVTVSALRELQ